MDALILAAGYGMRMDNLTKDIPKPLLKIKNKTLISYAIDLIKNMSFDKIIKKKFKLNIASITFLMCFNCSSRRVIHFLKRAIPF